MGYRRSYGNLCGSDSPPGGVSSSQYTPYCGNQHLVRLLIVVLLYFLRVRCHEYVVAVMVLSQMYSLTYSLTLMHLNYVANLCSAMIWCCANVYSTKNAHCNKRNSNYRFNKLSGGGDTYGIARRKSQLGT